MKTDNFQQLNLVAVIERANEILGLLSQLEGNMSVQRTMITMLINNVEAGNEWEHAALILASLEIMERCMRLEDENLEKAPEGWAGGFACVTTRKADEPKGMDLIHTMAAEMDRAKYKPMPQKPIHERKIAFEQLISEVQKVLLDYALINHDSRTDFAIGYVGGLNVQRCMEIWIEAVQAKEWSVPQQVSGICNILAASLP